MDSLNPYRGAIERILCDHASIPYPSVQIDRELVFDPQRDRYLLLAVDWDQKGHRVHGVVIHLDIIDGKVWIQYDGTERGVAYDLMEAGIPKDRIVLGFRSPDFQKYTEFAVA